MNSTNKTRIMVGSAMLAAVASVLMFFDFSVPVMPSFIKLDVSDLPALVGSFAYGPVSGVVISFLKNLLHIVTKGTSTNYVGELSNFLLASFFVAPAGFVYSKMKNKKGAFIGALIGALIMAVASVFTNYYITYPVYTNFMPMEVIIGMYQVINPNVNTLMECLVKFNMPFTFFKGMLNLALCMVVYKPLSPILKGKSKS